MLKKLCTLSVAATTTLGMLSTRAGAAVDPYLNNAVPSPGRSVFNGSYFDPITVSNQVPFVLARGYGRCLLVSNRTDVTLYDGAIAGSIIATARQVVDNGNCTGPNINEYMWVDTAKVFNDQIVFDCNNTHAEGYGPVTAWQVKPGCSVPGQSYGTYSGVFSQGPAKGNYRQFTVITTLYGQYATSPVNHWIY